MSPNRKADLQRKLAMAPIPKPPADLADRIKSDIPQHLLVDVRKERERLSRSIAFNLRVAASVILLIGSVYLALHVMTKTEMERTSIEVPANVVVAQKAQAPPAAPARVADTTQQPVELPKALPEPKTMPAPKRERARAEETKIAADGRATGMAAPQAVMAAPPPPPAAPPEATASDSVAESITVKASAPAAAKVSGGFVPEANAASLTLAPATLFDIAIPRAGAELKGHALIQHFAAPATLPRALRVDTELAAFQEKTLLRVSVDTPEVEHPDGGSLPPVAGRATLDVAFDEDAVASHHTLAGATHATESALPSGTSVTALFDVELKPGVDDSATIATVTMRYRSVADGKERVIPHKLRASDVRAWRYASKRMKSTSLAAALVYGFEPAEKIAERARAAGLEELAELAEKR
jgi:hypothetical protein